MEHAALAEFQPASEPRRCCQLAGHHEELRARVDTDRAACRADAPGNVARDGAAAAPDVEHALPRLHAEQIEVGLPRLDLGRGLGAELEATRKLARLHRVEAGRVPKLTLLAVLGHR